ncbi:hypothetical protein Q9L58_005009 [Maublancomyces gigas]|uniref:Uncharacterized protein n=1 Tax=Discina gigas TaxID=1032678 RepID=A0ABR3GKC0_9PEZI
MTTGDIFPFRTLISASFHFSFQLSTRLRKSMFSLVKSLVAANSSRRSISSRSALSSAAMLYFENFVWPGSSRAFR